MKILLVLLLSTSYLDFTKAEPPPYITTNEDSLAPPPPPIAVKSDSLFSSPSNNYQNPAPIRGQMRNYNSKMTTTAVFASPAPRAQFDSPSSAYSGPIAIGVTPSSSYRSPVAVAVPPSSLYGPPATRRTSSPVYSSSGSSGARYSANQYDAHSDPVNYEFAYSIMDVQSGSDFGHQESRQGDTAWGSYSVVLPDGRKQVVEYEADQNGYRPRVRYEQAGVGRSGGPY